GDGVGEVSVECHDLVGRIGVLDPPARFPAVMPMTAAIAPMFSAKHPRAAVIFDNLHMMHDIISDILAADTVPKHHKRAVIYQQLAEFRDGGRNVMSMDEWRNMGEMMGGLGAMGGPAIGLLTPAVAAPDAAPDMKRMDHGAMGHPMPKPDSTPAAPAEEHQHPAAAPPPGEDSDGLLTALMALHQRIMTDSVILRRVMADPELRRMMQALSDAMPPDHRDHMESMMKAVPPVMPKSPAAPPPPKPAPAKPVHQHKVPPADSIGIPQP
ncbi:MAG: hypothetical protein AABZ01_04765, partial [Gemmatimonadota bacterium]